MVTPVPDLSPENAERAAVLRLVEDAQAGGCRGWRGSFDGDGYPRAWWEGHYRRAGRLVYTWQVGEIPKGWTIDHTCRRRWCMETAHFEPLPRAEHARREAQRRRQDQAGAGTQSPNTSMMPTTIAHASSAIDPMRASNERMTDGSVTEPTTALEDSFAIVQFERIDRPQLQTKSVSLGELVAMLTRFDVLEDKHHGRCWSPMKYVEGAASRGRPLLTPAVPSH